MIYGIYDEFTEKKKTAEDKFWVWLWHDHKGRAILSLMLGANSNIEMKSSERYI